MVLRMSEDQEKKSTMIGKMFSPTFTAGDNILKNWEAVPIDDTKQYKVTRANGSSLVVEPGTSIEGKNGEVEVSLNSHGNLFIGDRTIIVGENVIPELSANRKGRSKSEFTVYSDNNPGKKTFVKVGEKHNDFGQIDLDPFGNLKTESGTIKMLYKEKELRLIVLDAVVANKDGEFIGHKAYINVYRPDNGDSQLNGVQGVYSPPNEKSSTGMFLEKYEDEFSVVTAKFSPARGNKSASVSMRSYDNAVDEFELDASVKFLEGRAAIAEIDPKMLPNYEAHKSSLDEIKNAGWDRERFIVNSGSEILLGSREDRSYSAPEKNPGF